MSFAIIKMAKVFHQKKSILTEWTTFSLPIISQEAETQTYLS